MSQIYDTNNIPGMHGHRENKIQEKLYNIKKNTKNIAGYTKVSRKWLIIEEILEITDLNSLSL
jgi:hypothetical protein